MEYVLGLIVFGVLVGLLYRMLKLSDANRYAEMNSREFEEEAKRASPAANVMIAVQKLVDPSHRVEYMQEAEESGESGTTPAAPPENG